MYECPPSPQPGTRSRGSGASDAARRAEPPRAGPRPDRRRVRDRPPASASAAPDAASRRPKTAERRGLVDGAIVAPLFHGALRRSEVAAPLLGRRRFQRRRRHRSHRPPLEGPIRPAVERTCGVWSAPARPWPAAWSGRYVPSGGRSSASRTSRRRASTTRSRTCWPARRRPAVGRTAGSTRRIRWCETGRIHAVDEGGGIAGCSKAAVDGVRVRDVRYAADDVVPDRSAELRAGARGEPQPRPSDGS